MNNLLIYMLVIKAYYKLVLKNIYMLLNIFYFDEEAGFITLNLSTQFAECVWAVLLMIYIFPNCVQYNSILGRDLTCVSDRLRLLASCFLSAPTT